MRPSPFPHVVCGVDGKEGGYVAVEQAASLAGRDSRLTLLAVTSFHAAGAIRSPALGPARVSEILDRAEFDRLNTWYYAAAPKTVAPGPTTPSTSTIARAAACAQECPCGAIAMEPEEI